MLMRLVVLGHNHQPGGVFIQSMDNPRPFLSTHAGEFIEVKLEGVDQGPRPVPLGRVNNHPPRLVHHHKGAVFIKHRDRNILGRWATIAKVREPDPDPVSLLNLVRSSDDFVVDQNGIGVDELLDNTSRKVCETARQIRVQAFAGNPTLDFKFLRRFRKARRHGLVSGNHSEPRSSKDSGGCGCGFGRSRNSNWGSLVRLNRRDNWGGGRFYNCRTFWLPINLGGCGFRSGPGCSRRSSRSQQVGGQFTR